MKTRRIVAGTVTGLTLAFATTTYAADILPKEPEKADFVGAWDCEMASPDFQKMSAKVEYFSDGSSTGIGSAEMQDGMHFEFEFLSGGEWELENGSLVEVVRKVKVTNLLVDGEQQNAELIEEFDDLLEESVVDIKISSEVILLSAERFVSKTRLDGIFSDCRAM